MFIYAILIQCSYSIVSVWKIHAGTVLYAQHCSNIETMLEQCWNNVANIQHRSSTDTVLEQCCKNSNIVPTLDQCWNMLLCYLGRYKMFILMKLLQPNHILSFLEPSTRSAGRKRSTSSQPPRTDSPAKSRRSLSADPARTQHVALAPSSLPFLVSFFQDKYSSIWARILFLNLNYVF